MKQLTCELCGGIDIVKQDGKFVCQSCGAKYTVDEAKKMVSEDGISPTVVGEDEDLSLLYEKAHIMLEEKDYEQALNIYTQILDKERKQLMPPNAESYFFVEIFFPYTLDYDLTSETIKFEVLDLLETMIRFFVEEDKQVIINQIKFLNKYVIALSRSNIDKATAFYYSGDEDEKLENYERYLEYVDGAMLFISSWIEVVGRLDEKKCCKDEIMSLYASYICIKAYYSVPETFFSNENCLKYDINYLRELLKYDPTFEPPLFKYKDGVTINLLDEINGKNTTEDSEAESSDEVDLSDERSLTETTVSEAITDTSDENEKSFLVKLCLIVAVVIILLAVCLPLIQTSPEKEEITPEPEPIKKEMVTKAVAPVKKEVVQKVDGIDLDFHEVIKLVIAVDDYASMIEPEPIENRTNMHLYYNKKKCEYGESENYYLRTLVYGININVQNHNEDGWNQPIVTATSDHACYLQMGELYFNNIDDYIAFTNKIHEWGFKKCYDDVEGLYRIPIRKMTISEMSVADYDDFYQPAYSEEGKQENGWYLVSFATQW